MAAVTALALCETTYVAIAAALVAFFVLFSYSYIVKHLIKSFHTSVQSIPQVVSTKGLQARTVG